jgi:hypothetical protein
LTYSERVKDIDELMKIYEQWALKQDRK